MKSVSYSANVGLVIAQLFQLASLLLLLIYLFLGSICFFRLNCSYMTALVWNTALSLVFFLQHSGMVRRSFRQRLERFVPEQFHGLVYGVSSSIVLILCLVLWQRIDPPIFKLEGALNYSVRVIFILGLAGFAWGAYSLNYPDSFGTRQARAHLQGKEVPDSPFVVKGPYRWVRHPFYFLAIVLFWSCPIMTLDRLLFNVLWTVWVVIATFLEERDLVSSFGEVYVRYQRQVPMILPWRIPA